MKKVQIAVHVGALINQAQGTKEKLLLKENFSLTPEDAMKVGEPFSCELYLIRLPHEIHVQIKNGKTAVLATCSRCLTPFNCPIEIPSAEREFLIDLPKESLGEGEELNYVDPGANQIALDGMIREEILLHFPPIPVCSLSCKGLCDQCGTNLNQKTCSCDPNSTRANPFTVLKTTL